MHVRLHLSAMDAKGLQAFKAPVSAGISRAGVASESKLKEELRRAASALNTDPEQLPQSAKLVSTLQLQGPHPGTFLTRSSWPSEPDEAL
jgi:hypothetical protein